MKYLYPSLFVGMLCIAGTIGWQKQQAERPVTAETETIQERIKLYGFYTESHKQMMEAWFLPSIQDNYELVIEEHEQDCPTGEIMRDGWKKAMMHKVNLVLRGIKENPGKIFVYSDVDIQFFRPTEATIVSMMEGKDLVIQKDAPDGEVNTGFFACRGNEKNLRLWEEIARRLVLPETKGHEQDLLNSLILRSNPYDIAWDYLPDDYMGGGTLTGSLWSPGKTLPIPDTITMHHANWTRGLDNKLAQLQYVKETVEARRSQA